jgi:hypothetical protein
VPLLPRLRGALHRLAQAGLLVPVQLRLGEAKLTQAPNLAHSQLDRLPPRRRVYTLLAGEITHDYRKLAHVFG